jgi:allantoinase
LELKKGALAVGADADFAVFDPDAKWTVTPQNLPFRHKISPYLGADLRGRVRETWMRGEAIFRESAFIGEPQGRELARP